MQCPHCAEEDNQDVLDSRHTERGQIRRRRKCRACGTHYSTLEVLAKQDGNELFPAETINFRSVRVANRNYTGSPIIIPRPYRATVDPD